MSIENNILLKQWIYVVVLVFVIMYYMTCRRILMEITGDVFKTIIEQYIVPLIPVADLKSKDNTGQQISGASAPHGPV